MLKFREYFLIKFLSVFLGILLFSETVYPADCLRAPIGIKKARFYSTAETMDKESPESDIDEEPFDYEDLRAFREKEIELSLKQYKTEEIIHLDDLNRALKRMTDLGIKNVQWLEVVGWIKEINSILEKKKDSRRLKYNYIRRTIWMEGYSAWRFRITSMIIKYLKTGSPLEQEKIEEGDGEIAVLPVTDVNEPRGYASAKYFEYEDIDGEYNNYLKEHLVTLERREDRAIKKEKFFKIFAKSLTLFLGAVILSMAINPTFFFGKRNIPYKTEPYPSASISYGFYEDEPIKKKTTYIIREGESLSRIAARWYGDYHKWGTIYELNREVIGEDPNHVEAGLTIEVPEDVDPGKIPASNRSGRRLAKSEEKQASEEEYLDVIKEMPLKSEPPKIRLPKPGSGQPLVEPLSEEDVDQTGWTHRWTFGKNAKSRDAKINELEQKGIELGWSDAFRRRVSKEVLNLYKESFSLTDYDDTVIHLDYKITKDKIGRDVLRIMVRYKMPGFERKSYKEIYIDTNPVLKNKSLDISVLESAKHIFTDI